MTETTEKILGRVEAKIDSMAEDIRELKDDVKIANNKANQLEKDLLKFEVETETYQSATNARIIALEDRVTALENPDKKPPSIDKILQLLLAAIVLAVIGAVVGKEQLVSVLPLLGG